MKATGTIKLVLPTFKETKSDGTTIKKKDFILEVPKPKNSTDGDRKPDTLALRLIGNNIDNYPIAAGDKVSVLFDSNARVSEGGAGNEAFDRKVAWKIYDEEEDE